MKWSSHLMQVQEYSLQPTTGLLKIHSENAQKGKDVLNFLKFKKKLNCLTFFNATTLQSRILTSANRLQEKCFLLSDLKYLKNFPEKRL